ncbi:muconolactone Delta-isomerase [Leucobacter luti]|uniref:Muconolactone Delta-isomerase n=1 Tax=Leucobacter luti TaxID=340320 RepID=A0A4R6S4Q6_9MICO|nr:muconolactone Delta-isomerase family protein [Leucobacter luti]MCW2286965.1 muconolactone D-isomerase [Leucobacter luti]QYM76858.1 muconolactone Delta-isomerase family protein [Leucobacter luti]TCK41192.1 muconolactone delta-isomerase [Leucobacter luti]TDP94244.1 muconolactone delta-isomerase [Leucobacter luti]
MSEKNEFLVNIQINWPSDLPEDTIARLSTEERQMAAELARAGTLVRMWRVPGRRENWGLWRAQDATQMHRILSELPVWPYMNVTVHALAQHPVDPVYT